MFVFVLNKNGRPLMPCKPSKARRLLQAGKANVVSKLPFTIKLTHGSSGYKQHVTAGMDTGSKTITLCEKCHADLHAGKFALKASKSKTKHATEMGIIKSQLAKHWRFTQTFGYETKFKRELLGLRKYDLISTSQCVGFVKGKRILLLKTY